MTEARALLYENALYIVDRIGEAADAGDRDPIFYFALAETLGRMIVQLRRDEPRPSLRRAKWEVSADSAA